MSARDHAVHLLPAGEMFRQGYGGAPVAVCGELVTSGADGEEDPTYCPKCVRAAIRWSAQPVTGLAAVSTIRKGRRSVMAGSAEITLTGILLTDPELQITPTGTVARFTVATDERRLDLATSQWIDSGTTLLPCSTGHHTAENVAESLTKGIRVLVTGVLQQREWETTEGDKSYAYEVHAREVGVSLNYATVRITGADTTGDPR